MQMEKKRVEERQKDPFFFFTVCTYWFLVGVSKICLTSLFLISCSLPLSKHISVNKEIPPPTWIRLAFHFISEPGCLSGPDHSVLIEPDSTAPVGLLNKLLRLCSACQPLSLPSLGSDFLPPLFLLLELKHL